MGRRGPGGPGSTRVLVLSFAPSAPRLVILQEPDLDGSKTAQRSKSVINHSHPNPHGLVPKSLI